MSKLTDHEFGARQEAFRRRVQDSGLVTQSFASPAELGQLVERSLRDLAQGFQDAKTLRGASALLDVLAMRRAFFHGDRRFINDAAINANPGLSIAEMLKYLDAGRAVSVAYRVSVDLVAARNRLSGAVRAGPAGTRLRMARRCDHSAQHLTVAGIAAGQRWS